MKFLFIYLFFTGLYAQEALFRIQINKITNNKWHFVHFEKDGVFVSLKSLEDYNINTDQFRGSVSKTQRIDLKKIAKSININENDFVIDAEFDLKYFKITENIGDGIYNVAFSKEGKGFLLNHNTTLTNTEKGKQQLASVLETNILMPNGAFYNSLYTSINQNKNGLSFKRMDTFWSNDYGRETFIIGDIATQSSNLLGSTRLGGIKYGTLFNSRIGFATYSQPSIEGSAAIPTTVDIFANNVRLLSQHVNAGKYNIPNIPTVSGEGTLIIETTDITGKKEIRELAYFLSPKLLKDGINEYSFEGGLRREEYLKKNLDYKDAVGNINYRYGLMKNWTIGTSLQAMRHLFNIEIANTFYVPYIGLFTVANALSKSNKGQGRALGINYTKNIKSLNFGCNINVKRGKISDIGTWPSFSQPKTSINTFIGVPLGLYSNISFSYLKSFETTGNSFKNYTVSYTTSLAHGLSFSLNGIRSFTTSLPSTTENNTGIFFTLSYTFDKYSISASQERTNKNKNTSSSFGVTSNYADGSYSGNLNLNDKNIGYNARITNKTGIGDLDFQVLGNKRQDQKSAHSQILNFSGAIGIIENQLFASRRISDSMVLVSVSGLPNVRVYNENRLVGVTNKEGKLIIPDIYPFQKHIIRIEEKDLPISHILPIKEKVIISPEYSAVLVDFEIKKFKVDSFIFRSGNGYIPSGSKVKFDTLPHKEFYVGYEGLVCVNNYNGIQHSGTIETIDSKCIFNANSSDVQAICVKRDSPK